MLGPLNYRPYLDKDWYASGGSEVVALGTTFCHTNHFMPTVSDEWIARNRNYLGDGAPPFSALLSQGRFVLRANTITQKLEKFLAHPLPFEISRFPIGQPLRKYPGIKIHDSGGELDEPEKYVPSVLTDCVTYHKVGSSVGNVSSFSLSHLCPIIDNSRQIDHLRPTEYPLHPFNPLSSQKYYPRLNADEDLSAEPAIRVIDSWQKFRV